jgi:hypothetical protein
MPAHTKHCQTQLRDGEHRVDSSQGSGFGPFPVFENVTPSNLAEIVSKYRAWAKTVYSNRPYPSCDFADISHKGVEDLIRNCYLASLQPEEGRYPRFHTIVSGPRRRPELSTRFAPPIALTDPNVLRKLAPTIAPDLAFSIHEETNGLYCDGIAVNRWEKNFLFHPENTYTSSDMPLLNGLCISVEAPGEITIAEEHLIYHTRGGRGWPELGVDFFHLTFEWLCELTAWVGSRLTNPAACGFSETDLHGVASNWLIALLWNRILYIAQSFRHGGAFVIRPTGDVDGIDLKRRITGFHLGEELAAHFNNVVMDPTSRSSDRYSLLTQAKSLAYLTTVDGCVVLDRNLCLQGFSGHIQIDDEYLQNQSRVFANGVGEPRSESGLRSLGARHNSAFRLCKAYPHQIVFVISQDGGIRVFSSDEKHVYEQSMASNPSSLLWW